MLRHPALRLMACLLFVFSQTPAVPAAVALVAWIDGAHRVEFRTDADRMTVVLRHLRYSNQHDNTLPTGHHHGWLTRNLLTFASADGNWHPDHRIEFKKCDEHLGQAGSLLRIGSKPAAQTTVLNLPDPFFHECTGRKPAVWSKSPVCSPDPVGLSVIVMLV